MPEKNPDLWAQVWMALSNPLWQGAIMAVIVSLLRILYDAKETSKRRICFEALICGALSLVASSLIEWMTWPPSLSVAAGGILFSARRYGSQRYGQHSEGRHLAARWR
ncbi:holin [Pseudomonas amygdali pv. eriobotryae]|nr:holin [Pseudomonas amygdali pv. eriobotryae]